MSTPCESPIYSSSSICLSSSSIKSSTKHFKANKDSIFLNNHNTDISGSFNYYTTATAKGDEIDCKDYLHTILNFPSWGWIIFTSLLIIFYRKKIYELIDIYIHKIKESDSGEIGAAGFKFAYNTAKAPTPLDSTSSNTNETSNNIIDGDSISNDNSDYFYPAYKDILNNKVANKILSTLWNYQQTYGKNNNNNIRWSFRVPNDKEFDFIASKLYWSGLIIANRNQFMLSNVGIRFCKKHQVKLNLDDIYSSFLE